MLNKVISELVDERGLSQQMLSEIVEVGILAAYQKKYPDFEFKLQASESQENFDVLIKKEVVSGTEGTDLSKISLRKARYINKNIESGEYLWLPFEGSIGRVEILRAKQVIAAKIKELEAQEIYKEFIDKKGSVVHGTVHKVERKGVLVYLRDTLAFLPKENGIPRERLSPGWPAKALLKDVHEEYRGDNQLILDRSSADFLKKLLELEIPEVYDNLIEIKALARRAGYKAKMIVASNDPNIDPVGTCVGVGGARIKPILKELGGEKIDVISWINSKEELVKSALRPAEVNDVEVVDENKVHVWISEDQRAYAIGKNGQNVALASELLHVEIDLLSSQDSTASFMNADQETDESDMQ